MRMLAPRTVFAISLTLAMAFSAATFATTEAVSGRDLAQSRLCDQAIAEAEPHTAAQKKALRDQRRAKIFFGILEA